MSIRRLQPPPGTPEPDIQFVRLSRISPHRELWHVRRTYNPAELAELASAISASGVLEPLDVLPPRDGLYPLVDGWLRFLAVRQDPSEDESTFVPVHILDMSDPVHLLQRLFLTNTSRTPLKTLEIGWAMHALDGLLGERDLPHERADVCARLGLTGRKSLASEAWAAADAMPLQLAQDAESQGRIGVTAIGRTPRAALREFKRASPKVVPLMREVLLEALAERRPPATCLRAAREQLAVPEVLQVATETHAAGRPLSPIFDSDAHASGTHGPSGSSARGAAYAVRCLLVRALRRSAAAVAATLAQLTAVFTRLAQE